MAEPKTKKAPETDAPEAVTPDAEKAPEAVREEPVVREERSYADRMERELRRPRGGEGAVIVSALVELHRASLHDGSSDGRYLATARVIGDSLVEEILGPSERLAR